MGIRVSIMKLNMMYSRWEMIARNLCMSDNESMFLNRGAHFRLVNATAESGELDNSLGNMDNQILGTRSLTRVSILVSRPCI